jgi:hypothetical protein
VARDGFQARRIALWQHVSNWQREWNTLHSYRPVD